ncbi:hypothetical protein FNF27_06632 [Cafeteria roenbergensis]|uniref:ER membrane protein complex subunit 7 beta-sandwich domain-containing protein n=1 Tax=Cafeteria roenbergensis TaxID=33653 RepID=A0A5A8DK28_CAFRO|nr:hypothetical protein FNF29_03703 [Cafeteria roenbergensis]KAA0165712.1 hypothetical protein FNF31_01689 [Cafeteria roenbergensis]KAA0170375.1 hypothetical protein FNF27_06632 [Cafeteria roenbergensis]KAA0171434.1 hypothetical protein FNF28_00646 [Cafeteria roenbergensis]|eukprot:KAA0152816.1 hypothetical protein FNF29_03703 [Cafeteria roenbergensis]
MRGCSLLAVLALAAAGARAAVDVSGAVRLGVGASTPTALRLDGGWKETWTRADGSFTFFNVPEGVYLLEASHPQHVFPTTKIRISADGSVKALSYAFPGAERQIVAYPLRLSPVAQPNYFVQKPQPSLISMLSNPQVLIMGFMLVATFFMQSNSSSQSKEQKEEMRQQMKEMGFAGNPGDLQGMMSKLMGGGAAAADSDDEG